MTARRAAALLLAGMLALTGCAAGLSDTGEPLTAAQADTLAQVRFRLAAHGDGAVELTTGAADAVDHVAARLTVDFDDGIAWGEIDRGPEGIAVTERVAFSAQVYLVDGPGGWRQAAAPTPMLAVLFGLGADRPENAQLLRQSDARHLGSAEDEGRTLDVFRAPSTDGGQAHSRLWLDGDGALRRMDAGDDETLIIRPTGADPAPRIAEVDRLLGASDD